MVMALSCNRKGSLDKTLLSIVRNVDMKSEVVLNTDVSMTQPSRMASLKRQQVMQN